MADSRQCSVADMPIRLEMKSLYPENWREISARIRFVRAKGKCEHCGRPHRQIVTCLPDGRWFDEEVGWWRDGRGDVVADPDLLALQGRKLTRVILAAAHRNHHPEQSDDANLVALCQRCHIIHDRPHHIRQRRITYRMRRAIGDLFEGGYRI